MTNGSGAFFKRVIVYGLGTGANRLLGLISWPVLTAYLSPAEFGQIASLTIFSVILRTAFGAGVSSAVGVVFFEKGDLSHQARAIGSAATYAAVSGTVLVLGAVIFSRWIAGTLLDDQSLYLLIIIYSSAIALQICSEILLLCLQFNNRAWTYVAISVFVPVVGVCVIVALVAFSGLGVLAWGLGQAILSIGQIFVGFVIVWRLGLIGRPDMALLKSIFRIGIPLLPTVAFSYFLQYGGHIMLKARTDLAELGIYNIGFSLGMAANLITTAFGAAWYPHFQSFNDKQDAARTVFSQISVLYVAGLCMLVSLAYLFAEPAVAILTQPAFHSAYTIVGPIALSQAVAGFWIVLLPVMYFKKQVYFTTIFQFLASLVIAAEAWALIPSNGGEGAAYAIAIGTASLVLAQVIYNALSGLDACRYRWTTILPIVLLTAVYIVVLRLIGYQFGFVSYLIAGGGGGIVLAYLIVFQVLGAKDRAKVWSLLLSLRH